MKHIHLPTLLMHLALLLLARLTISSSPDFFLGCAIVVLILHVGLAVESKRSFSSAHLLGMGLYLLAPTFGLVNPDSGAFGLGGGGFAWFFYGVALAVSFVIISIIDIVRMIRKI